MNNSFYNTRNTSRKLDSTSILVLISIMLPVLLVVLMIVSPSAEDTAKKTTVKDESVERRASVAERRAERAEARKAKQAEKKAATTVVQYDMPSFPMDPGMNFGGFDPAMGFDNSMAMAPGFGGGFGGGMGPGMGFGGF